MPEALWTICASGNDVGNARCPGGAPLAGVARRKRPARLPSSGIERDGLPSVGMAYGAVYRSESLVAIGRL